MEIFELACKGAVAVRLVQERLLSVLEVKKTLDHSQFLSKKFWLKEYFLAWGRECEPTHVGLGGQMARDLLFMKEICQTNCLAYRLAYRLVRIKRQRHCSTCADPQLAAKCRARITDPDFN